MSKYNEPYKWLMFSATCWHFTIWHENIMLLGSSLSFFHGPFSVDLYFVQEKCCSVWNKAWKFNSPCHKLMLKYKRSSRSLRWRTPQGSQHPLDLKNCPWKKWDEKELSTALTSFFSLVNQILLKPICSYYIKYSICLLNLIMFCSHYSQILFPFSVNQHHEIYKITNMSFVINSCSKFPWTVEPYKMLTKSTVL